MNLKTALNSTVLSVFLVASLAACGGSKGNDKPPIQEPPIKEPPIVVDPIEEVPTNTISHAYFRDQDSSAGKIAGTISIKLSAIEQTQPF